MLPSDYLVTQQHKPQFQVPTTCPTTQLGVACIVALGLTVMPAAMSASSNEAIMPGRCLRLTRTLLRVCVCVCVCVCVAPATMYCADQGFELKRRGELKLIKVFQSEVSRPASSTPTHHCLRVL